MWNNQEFNQCNMSNNQADLYEISKNLTNVTYVK